MVFKVPLANQEYKELLGLKGNQGPLDLGVKKVIKENQEILDPLENLGKLESPVRL